MTQGDHEGRGVIVSWVTVAEPGSDTVLYWSENSKRKNRAEGIMVTYKFYNYTSGYIHHCTLKNLEVRMIFILNFLVCFGTFPGVLSQNF